MARPADFLSMVKRRRDAAVQFVTDKPAKDRREALKFYRGDNDASMAQYYGDAGDGLSTVVSRDTMEAIESMMPPLLRPFVAGEEVVSFDPIGKEDEDACQQTTDYVNQRMRRDNNILHLAQTSLKDGLLLREGIAKTVLEEVEEGPPETYAGLSLEELKAVDRTRITGDIEQDPITGGFSVTLAPKKVKRFRVHIIAPGEWLREERLASMDDGGFFGHRKEIRVAELIASGIDAAKAKSLPPGVPEIDEERDDRFRQEGGDEPEWSMDDLSRKVWVDELYIECDYEGEGVLSWRKVILGGGNSTELSDEPSDAPFGAHPYSHWTPIPIPHSLTGQSMFDLTKDIQMNKTAMQREFNNAMYLANRPMRTVVNGQANIDDLLNPRVGGIVRVSAPDSVQSLPSGGDAAFSATLQGIVYLDGVREARTGVTRYNQGMDSNSLNKTATGMNIIASNSQQRQELVARQFGEFLKDIFQKLFGLIVAHADPEDVQRLTNKPFIPWPSDYDMSVNVGLGNNNKDQLVGHIMSLLQLDQSIVQLQGGVNGPILTAQNIYEKLKKLPEAMGMKGNYYTDPSDQSQAPQQQQLPPPDPTAEAKIKAQAELQKEDMRQHGAMAREVVKQAGETHRAQSADVVPLSIWSNNNEQMVQ